MSNMLRYFKWRNVFSFADEGEISFEVNQKAPDSDEFTNIEKTKLSKVEGIYGPNASGKTNVIKILNFIKYFIVSSYIKDKNSYPIDLRHTLDYDELGYMNSKEESFMEVSFFIANISYTYSFLIKEGSITKEQLQRKTPGSNLTTIFERNEQIIKSSKHLQEKHLNHVRAILDKTSSVISTLHALKNIENKSKAIADIVEYWERVQVIPTRFQRADLSLIDALSKLYLKIGSIEDLQKFYSEIDMGEHELTLKNLTVLNNDDKNNVIKQGTYLTPSFIRKNSRLGTKKEIFLPNESAGIIELFFKYFQTSLPIKKQFSILAMDELELGLHPELATKLVNFFLSSTNASGQILFTTHMTPLLIDLNKYQVHLVEKNKFNESRIFRLDQVEGVRLDDNLFKKYMAGAYGGFPKIDT